MPPVLGEILPKFLLKPYYANFTNVFKDLPLICFVHCNKENICCLHGGIPIKVDKKKKTYELPDLTTWEFKNREIVIDNMDEISQQILWNDPIAEWDSNQETFYPNQRGMGYMFGKEIFEQFLPTKIKYL